MNTPAVTLNRYVARSYWPVIIATWASFLVLAVLATDPFVDFFIAEIKWLYAARPASWILMVPAMGWSAIISVEILVLGAALVALHEASHILAHRLMGTPAKRIHLKLHRVTPRILVDGFESWKVKVLATAAPLVTTLLPAAAGLALTRGSAWQGFFAFAAVMAWGICVSDVNVLLNYMNIPRNARIRVSEGGKKTEWRAPSE